MPSQKCGKNCIEQTSENTSLVVSGVKMSKLTLNFPNRNFFLAYERNEFTLCKNTLLQAWRFLEHSFYDVAKAKYGWIGHNKVSGEPRVVESGFIAQIKQEINVLTDFQVLYLRNQSLWINYSYFILRALPVLL